MRKQYVALGIALLSASVTAVAARAAEVYVTNYYNGTVALVPDAGGAATTFATGLKQPEGIAFGAGGTLYVDNQTTGVIDSINASGKVTPFVTIPLGSDIGVGAMTSDAAGNLYVSLLTPSQLGQIDKVTPSGVITTYATNVGNPQQIAFDSSGDLFVADIINSSIDKVAPGGGVATTFASGLQYPIKGIAVDSVGNVYVSDALSTGGYIEKFSPTGTDLGPYASVATPEGLAFLSDGKLLVASDANIIDAVASSNQKVTKYATGKQQVFDGPLYMVVDVPEPSVLGMLAIAGIGLIARRSRACDCNASSNN